jgi:hypothetical protein
LGAALIIAHGIVLPGFVRLDEPTMSGRVNSVLESYKSHERERAEKFLEEVLLLAKKEGIDAEIQILGEYSTAIINLANLYFLLMESS